MYVSASLNSRATHTVVMRGDSGTDSGRLATRQTGISRRSEARIIRSLMAPGQASASIQIFTTHSFLAGARCAQSRARLGGRVSLMLPGPGAPVPPLLQTDA